MVYPYEVLAVAENASQDEIRKAYLQKIHRFPPEKCPNEFQAIVEAYELVKEPVARARLKLFGLPGNKEHMKFSSLVEPEPPLRTKAGISAWLKVIREEEV
jgi:curved DNA-binding protein CbpA